MLSFLKRKPSADADYDFGPCYAGVTRTTAELLSDYDELLTACRLELVKELTLPTVGRLVLPTTLNQGDGVVRPAGFSVLDAKGRASVALGVMFHPGLGPCAVCIPGVGAFHRLPPDLRACFFDKTGKLILPWDRCFFTPLCQLDDSSYVRLARSVLRARALNRVVHFDMP